MRVEYRVYSLSVAHILNFPGSDKYRQDRDLRRFGIWRFENGVAKELIGTDDGNGDQTLHENFNWVVEALRNAYQLGLDK